MTDGSGNTTATYGYDVFGAIRSESGSSAAKNERRFTGEQRDSQLNRSFYYLRARYYDPGTGRFLSKDPVPLDNLYAYVGNNPVNLIDPYGMWGCPIDPTKCDVPDPVEDAFDSTANAAVAVYQAGDDVVEVTAPIVAQCAIWGGAGFVATGNPTGAAAGCAAGSVSYVVGEYIISNPVSECAIWGAGGYWGSGGSWVGAAGGCLAGAASWFDSNYGYGTPLSQCGSWGIPAAIFDTRSLIRRAVAGLAACTAGAGSSFIFGGDDNLVGAKE